MNGWRNLRLGHLRILVFAAIPLLFLLGHCGMPAATQGLYGAIYLVIAALIVIATLVHRTVYHQLRAIVVGIAVVAVELTLVASAILHLDPQARASRTGAVPGAEPGATMMASAAPSAYASDPPSGAPGSPARYRTVQDVVRRMPATALPTASSTGGYLAGSTVVTTHRPSPTHGYP